MTTVDLTRASFLREMTDRHERLVVWKHLDRALLGRGDIDAAAPRSDVMRIRSDSIDVARESLGATYVICCDHIAHKKIQFFVQPHLLPHVFEFDVCVQPSRGLAPWADPGALLQVSIVRPDGIRALSPGAESVVSLVYHGISPTGHSRLEGDEAEIVRHGLSVDLAGALEACSVLPPRPARRPLHELVITMADGEWDQVKARRAFAAFAGSAFAHPLFTGRRLRFRAGRAAGVQCIVSICSRRHGRQIQNNDLDGFLRKAQETGHIVRRLQ